MRKRGISFCWGSGLPKGIFGGCCNMYTRFWLSRPAWSPPQTRDLVAGAGRKVQWVHIILALEAAILFGIGFLPSTVPHAIVNVVISFVASVQVSSFQSLMGSPFATTMTTGNLRSAVQAYYQAVTRKNKPALQKALCYTWIIVSFCGGAMIGVWTSYFFGTYSLFLCVAILTASLIWSVVDKKVCGESAEDEEKSE